MYRTKSIIAIAALAGILLAGCKETPYISSPGDNTPIGDEKKEIPDSSFIDSRRGMDSVIQVLKKSGVKEELIVSVNEASNICKTLVSGEATSERYYVYGYISSWGTGGDDGGPVSKSYGNAYFYMKDHVTDVPAMQFYCYRVYWLNEANFTSTDQVKEGKRVIINCRLYNYGGTYETPGKSSPKDYVYYSSWTQPKPQTSGDGSYDKPYSVQDVLTMGQYADTTKAYYFRSKINGIAKIESNTVVYEYEVPEGKSAFSKNSNILLADAAGDQTAASNIVAMIDSNSEIKDAVNLRSNKDNLHKEILLCGTLGNTNLGWGLKSVKYAELDGKSYGTKQ